MILENKSERTFQHSYIDKNKKLVTLNLKPNTHMEIPNKVAEIWLKTGEVVEYVDPAEAKKAAEEAEKIQAELEKENADLKAYIKKLEAEAKKAAEEAEKSEQK